MLPFVGNPQRVGKVLRAASGSVGCVLRGFLVLITHLLRLAFLAVVQIVECGVEHSPIAAT